jgi:glyoxylase-like metal-dependent hydrolase (beta-lactamase superfamily II)
VNVTHLNCGTMREIPADGRPAARAVCHCLVVEADHGLVLVETGFGAVDVGQPDIALGPEFLARTEPLLDLAETAAAQLAARGYDPADVTDIVLTHLDLDHCGGLPDFPAATVHVHDAEYRAAMAVSSGHPEHQLRYRPAHWAHRPRWSTYPSRRDTTWFGFDAVVMAGLPSDVLLVPLAGHTPGHCAVAVRTADRWLMHAGDAFYYDGQIAADRWAIPLWDAFEEMTEMDRPLRQANQSRLRELSRDHADEVAVFSAHDPWAYADLAGVKV